MASLRGVRDRNGFLANREIFDRATTKVIVGDTSVIHVVEFDLPATSSRISDTQDVGGVSVKGNFYLANLDAGLRFFLSEFIIRVWVDYGIAPSQPASNSWRILSIFYIDCMMAEVYLISRIFRFFTS